MFKRFFRKFVTKFEEQSPTTKGFIIMIVLLVIGILLRWDTVISEIKRGFSFFSMN